MVGDLAPQPEILLGRLTVAEQKVRVLRVGVEVENDIEIDSECLLNHLVQKLNPFA